MFVIQTRIYILKCVNSSVLFTEMACDKNQTYLQGGESGIGRISGGWKFPNSPIYDQSESADYHLTTVFTQATP
jgi:hypothetical protein